MRSHERAQLCLSGLVLLGLWVLRLISFSKWGKMMNTLCGSMENLRSSETSCKKQHPNSPTRSISESNVVASELDQINASNLGLQSLKFDVDIDIEVQSLDNSIWETLFADQIESGVDFMIFSPKREFMVSSPKRDYYMVSSPKREFMVSSPKREYMVSSPKREYMVSSPKRDYMVSSPRREHMVSSPRKEFWVSSPKRSSGMNSSYFHNYGCVQGMSSCNSPQGGAYKGKSQSPLHKVFSNSSSTQCVHGENLPLPAMDGFLDEFHLESYTEYPAMKGSGIQSSPEELEVLPALLDYLSIPESRFCGSMSDTTTQAGDLYQMNHFATGQQEQPKQRELDHGLLGLTSSKLEQVEASYYSLIGPVSSEPEPEQEQDSGLELVHLLLACAEAVAKEEYMSARRFLHHLNRVVSPLGDSMQRVASFFTDALAARLAATLTTSPTSPKPFNPPTNDVLKIYQILYQACPYVKFAHFTANQAIFEAFESEDRVHIIDLDILQGYQWPAFIQALAARPGGAPFLRITGVGSPLEAVRETGRHLTELAHSLRVPFQFHPVGERLEDLQPHMFHRRVGEALAVNSVNRLHRVAGTHLGNLLGMIRDQAPNIITLVEQEASHNGPYFLGRFLEALHYYSAIFDSLDSTFPIDSAARAKVEQYIFAPEIQNIVACEGVERVERHERVEKWRKVMEGKGFKGVALSSNAVTQSKILLGLYSCDGYRLTEEKGCLLLGWQDRPLIAASAWRC